MDSVEFLKLNEQFDNLEVMISGLQDMVREMRHDSKDRSYGLSELMGALAKAQSEMRIAGKDSNNPYFKSKYADLASVVAASRPALTKNGLSVMQQITVTDSGQRVLMTILGHSSGEYITSSININPVKEDIQSIGSAITYLRRYAYASLVGVVADDEDDDGEINMKPLRTQSNYSINHAPKQVDNKSPDKVSKDQLSMLERKLIGMEDVKKSIFKRYGYESLEDVDKDKFELIYEGIEKIRRLQEEARA